MGAIDRETAIDAWKNDFKEYINALNMPKDDYNGIMEYIDEVPSAKPERKTGMTKEQVVFWLLLLRFNPDNNVLPNEVIDIAIGAIVAQPERKTGYWIDKTAPECDSAGKVSGMRLIDADKLLEELIKLEVYGKLPVQNFEYMVRNAPTEPEIIRCKDCKYYGQDIFDRGGYCKRIKWLDCNDEDYCSFAVMKNE